MTLRCLDMTNLLIFVGLQLLDAATTLGFLARGVAEGNPLVRGMLHFGWYPAVAIALVKAGACLLGWFAWKSRRQRLLRRANVFFALCIAWNVTAILTA